MTYFKALVVAISMTLLASAPAQAAKTKDALIGRLALVKRKITFSFSECKETSRNNYGYQCVVPYSGSKFYDAVVNAGSISKGYDTEIAMNETYSAVASLFPAGDGHITFQFYVKTQITGGSAPVPAQPLTDEAIQQVKDAYAAQRPLTVEFYVQTVR